MFASVGTDKAAAPFAKALPHIPGAADTTPDFSVDAAFQLPESLLAYTAARNSGTIDPAVSETAGLIPIPNASPAEPVGPAMQGPSSPPAPSPDPSTREAQSLPAPTLPPDSSSGS
jgi:hypothetical protein